MHDDGPLSMQSRGLVNSETRPERTLSRSARTEGVIILYLGTSAISLSYEPCTACQHTNVSHDVRAPRKNADGLVLRLVAMILALMPEC